MPNNRLKQIVLIGYRAVRRINRWLERCRIRVYAAQASFFMIISAVPMLMLVLSLSGMLLPRGGGEIRERLWEAIPSELSPFMETVWAEMEEKANPSVLSVSLLTLLWSASRGIKSIGAGIRNVCGGRRDRDPVIYHAKYLFYTFLYMVAVLFSLGIWVFGDTLAARGIWRGSPSALRFLNRTAFLLLLIFFFLFTFRGMTGICARLRWYLPGAVFSAFGWLAFSRLFEFFVEHYARYSYLYGSLTSLIVVMLWLYSCMEILLMGAGVNTLWGRHIQ